MLIKHEQWTEQIIQAFYTIYHTLGYGFLEKVYDRIAQGGSESGTTGRDPGFMPGLCWVSICRSAHCRCSYLGDPSSAIVARRT